VNSLRPKTVYLADCKSGGYNLESTYVNQTRFLALILIIAFAYSLATLQGQWLQQSSLNIYAGRLQQPCDKGSISVLSVALFALIPQPLLPEREKGS
jgi:hypothetical protein